MKKLKRMADRAISLVLVFAMLCAMQGMTAFAQTADESDPAARAAEVSQGDIISFGSYPQSEVTGSALTDAIVDAEYDANGDATVDGQKYRRYKKAVKVTKDEYEQYVQEHHPGSSQDVTVSWDTAELLECEKAKTEREGTYRYFKWEPVKWKVLENDTEAGELFVMADMALDAVNYYNAPNNTRPDTVLWKDSSLRQWLNDDAAGFYQMAFDGNEKSSIKASANAPEGDRVYLLSDEEVKNPAYGFENTDGASDSRKMMASAYAQARGASVYSPSDYRCFWLLRTPGQSGHVKMVYVNGAVNGNFTEYDTGYLFDGNRYERTFDGCVPAMRMDACYSLKGQLCEELRTYKADVNYRDAQKKERERAVNKGIRSINAASGEEAVRKALEDAKAAIDRIKTAEQMAAGTGTESKPQPGEDAGGSDKSVLKSLDFDIPSDSSYKQDDMPTGTTAVSTMSELVVTQFQEGKEDGSKTFVFDHDKADNAEGIRDAGAWSAATAANTYAAPSLQNPYSVTETVDADGDGRKELLAQLYFNGREKGQEIMMSLFDISAGACLLQAYPTGGYIETSMDIDLADIRGHLSMRAGDFDGDGSEELAVYAPNNREETADGSVLNALQIKVFRLDIDAAEPVAEQQVIDVAQKGDCEEWARSYYTDGKKRFARIPQINLTAGDIDNDGVDDLLTVASFSKSFDNAIKGDSFTWEQLWDPNNCLTSVLDVYLGQRQDRFRQAVKKRALVSHDPDQDYSVLSDASAAIANVTGAHTNEIVFGGRINIINYTEDTTTDTVVGTNKRYDRGILVVGYVTAQGLLSNNDLTASMSYNWTQSACISEANQDYYVPGRNIVTLDGFAQYGSGEPDTIAIEGALFNYSADDGKLACTRKAKENAYINAFGSFFNITEGRYYSQVAGNVTNDPFGRETLYFVEGYMPKNDQYIIQFIYSIWGEVDADGNKNTVGKIGVAGLSDIGFQVEDNKELKGRIELNLCDIDEDSSLIQYEEGNTDVYYSNVELLSVLQAAPVYEELGEDYVSGAETSYGKSSGSSAGTGHSHQVSAGVIAGFEHETSLLGLVKLFSMEATFELSVTAGWEFEKTTEKEFTTEYNTGGTEDVAVLYTVPYVRYNAQIYIPEYTLPTREEYEAKKAFATELEQNLARYDEYKAGVTGGTYAAPTDGYNDEYTTNVTKNNYDHQVRLLQSYAQWIQETKSQMEGFEGSEGLAWGATVEGGWEDYFFCVPQTPMITSVAADTYNEIAEGCKDLEPLYGTALPSGYVAGSPDTYPSNVNDLKDRARVVDKSVEEGKTNASGDGFISSTAMSASSSAPSQSIAFSEENAKTKTIGGGFSMEMVATVGPAKGGVSLSTDHEASWSSATTEGCEYSGQVPNLPKRPDDMTLEEYSKYNYRWKLVAYEAMVNGSKVPVVGYYTRYDNPGEIPPSAPGNVEFEKVTSGSATLTWNGGTRAADHYNVYRVTGTGSRKNYEKVGSVAFSENKDGAYSFTHSGLTADQTYAYAVAAFNADESIRSVYSEEVATTIPIPAFDVKVKLGGINSGETVLAGTGITLTAELVTENYPQSVIDQYNWQVNDGNGWRKLSSDGEAEYGLQALLAMDGNQYRCSAYVAVDDRLYRLYSDEATLHVRKAAVQLAISADKKEGAADSSSEFGLAEYSGDILKLTANVSSNDMEEKGGRVVFVVTGQTEGLGVKEYSADVSADGTAQAECRFEKAGRYTISARYVGNEIAEEAQSGNTLPYYAYPSSEKEERSNGQNMEQAINDQVGGGFTVDNVIAKKDSIQSVKEQYDKMTEEQKGFVDTKAKETLENAVNHLEAAETIIEINKIGTVTDQNAKEKKDAVDKAQKAYDALTDEQKALVPDAVKKALKAASDAVKKASDAEAEDGTENLTPEEKKQADDLSLKLGIDKKDAVLILQFAGREGIEMDTLLLTEDMILKTKSDKDVKGSVFGRLQAKASKVTSNQVKLSWKKMNGADGYLVYQGECGKKSGYKLIKNITKGSAASFTAKKLAKGKGYRFIVRAYKKAGEKMVTISASKSVHIVTNGGKKANAKSIKLGKVKKTLKKGKTLALKASIAKQKKKTPNCRKLCYESSDSKVATVTKAGKVKAKAKGKCTIYIYAHNGLCKQVKITVK